MYNTLIISLKLILIVLFLIDLYSDFWYTIFKKSLLYTAKYFISDCKILNYFFETFEFLESPILSALKLIVGYILKRNNK